ncbi:type III PLP-dependent enzyme domain-containing protein [Halomonas sp. 328]|uniref:GNAT family N-acetyltransferase n=1 Tax=Halomonas sp. 328 TaxID=2776704 RepID=UPI0018A6EA4E|nr:GNAT family N-acetyltransferase [Halomonas sp. 328]MBF8224204.1 GNAT family N-acetyltransferase [Halomonas sp. 328]
MLATLKRWLTPLMAGRADSGEEAVATSAALVSADEGDIAVFLTALERAELDGASPWRLGGEERLEALRRALEFVVRHGVWPQLVGQRIAYWQGQLLTFRTARGAPLGMLLVCRSAPESAWQLLFFFIVPEARGRGHGAQLLSAACQRFPDAPLQARLPKAASAAQQCLITTGFRRQHIDALGMVTYELAQVRQDMRINAGNEGEH